MSWKVIGMFIIFLFLTPQLLEEKNDHHNIFREPQKILFMVCFIILLRIPMVTANKESETLSSSRITCECGSCVTNTGRNATITLYTRQGVIPNVLHSEKRCKSCYRGYFYGFFTHGHNIFYDDNCLGRLLNKLFLMKDFATKSCF